MIAPIHFVLEVLRNNIIVEDKIVPVIKRSYPLDKSPCITIDDSGGSAIISKDLCNELIELPPNHPQYEPNKKIPQEIILTKQNTTLNLNVWCDNENERELINKNIRFLFDKAFTDNYFFCTNYDDGECATIQSECEAITNTGMYGIKGQCPKKKEYNYQNIFKKYDIDKYSFTIEEPFSLDDTSTKPPILRSIIRVRMSYYTTTVIGGLETTDYEWEENYE